MAVVLGCEAEVRPAESPGPEAADTLCEDACAERANDGCFSRADCLTACDAQVRQWTTAVRDAFSVCVREDPLCFITLEGCMLGQLGSKGRVVRVLGFMHGAHEGRTVSVQSDGGELRGESTIQLGSFHFEWVSESETFDQTGPLLLSYIDVDGDGSCTQPTDETSSETATWNGSFESVEYELTLNAPLDDPEFVCGALSP